METPIWGCQVRIPTGLEEDTASCSCCLRRFTLLMTSSLCLRRLFAMGSAPWHDVTGTYWSHLDSHCPSLTIFRYCLSLLLSDHTVLAIQVLLVQLRVLLLAAAQAFKGHEISCKCNKDQQSSYIAITTILKLSNVGLQSRSVRKFTGAKVTNVLRRHCCHGNESRSRKLTWRSGCHSVIWAAVENFLPVQARLAFSFHHAQLCAYK